MFLRHLEVFLALGGLAAAAPAAQLPYDASEPGILTDANLAPQDDGLGRSQRNGPGSRGRQWEALAAPTYARSRCGGGTEGLSTVKDFWVIGGETSTGRRIARVERWHRLTNTWSTSASLMPRPVSNISGSAAFVNGLFYVFGGLESGDVPVAEIQVYDTVSDTWAVHATRLPVARFGMGAAHIGGGQVLVCGGADLLYYYGDSWIFDTTTGALNPGPAMAAPDFNMSVTAEANPFDSRVYMTGIATNTYMQTFDVVTRTFAVGPSFVGGGARAGCGLVNIGAKVIAYAGDWLGYRDDTEVYDASTGGSSIVPLLAMIHGRRSCAYGSTICPGILAVDGFSGAYMAHAEGVR